MKQKDIALIAIIVFISAIFSFFISGALFKSSSELQQAEVVKPISANFPRPDIHYFNNKAFDPTLRITIGNNANTDPFNGAGN